METNRYCLVCRNIYIVKDVIKKYCSDQCLELSIKYKDINCKGCTKYLGISYNNGIEKNYFCSFYCLNWYRKGK